jgi:hypothetical protein
MPRREVLYSLPRDRYLVRHEEKTDVSLPEQHGRRVVQVKKTFFDGKNRIEFAIEKEIKHDDDFDAVLADIELAVNQFFAS